MTNSLFWDFGFLVSSVIYGYLTFHMYGKYRESKLEASAWLLAFCSVMTIGMFVSFVTYVTSPSVQDADIFMYLITHIFSSLSIAILFSLGLVMIEKKKYFFIPFGYTLLQIIAQILFFMQRKGNQVNLPPYDILNLNLILNRVSYIVLVIPIIILFFYLFLQTGSDKSLGFSLGMLMTLAAGFLINISYDISGILWVLGSFIVLFGIKGYLKPILSKIRS